MSLSLVVTHVLSVAWGAAVFPPVAVEATGVACPRAELVTGALTEARQGALPSSDAPHVVRVDAGALVPSSPSGEGRGRAASLTVTLVDGRGTSLWTRQLANVEADCAGAARAIAIIVAEHFRDLSWTPAPTPVAATPPGPAASESVAVAGPLAPSPSAGPPTVASTGMLARRRVASIRPLWSLGVGAAFERRAEGRLTMALGTRVRLRGPWGAGLTVFLPPWHASVDVGQGHVDLDAWPLALDLGGEWTRRGLYLLADARGLVTVEGARTTGLGQQDTVWRAVLAAGVSLGAGIAFSERVRFVVKATALRSVLGRSFTVAGWQGAVVEPPAWQAALSLSLEWMSSS